MNSFNPRSFYYENNCNTKGNILLKKEFINFLKNTFFKKFLFRAIMLGEVKVLIPTSGQETYTDKRKTEGEKASVKNKKWTCHQENMYRLNGGSNIHLHLY